MLLFIIAKFLWSFYIDALSHMMVKYKFIDRPSIWLYSSRRGGLQLYSVGDIVSYPMHGAGVVENIEKREILGKECQYYVLRFLAGGMKVLVPVNNIKEVGLREVIDKKLYELVFKVFEREPSEDNANWNKRYRENLEKLRSGDILEVADVVKGLWQREKQKGLSTGEKKMLNTARQILLSELVLVCGEEEDEVFKRLELCV